MKQKSTLFFLGLVILSIVYAVVYTFTQSDNISQSTTQTVQKETIREEPVKDASVSETTQIKSASLKTAPVPEDLFWKIFIFIETVLVGMLVYHFYGKYRKTDYSMKIVRANIKKLREEKLIATVQDEAIAKVRTSLRKKRFDVKHPDDLVKYAKKLEISTSEIQLANRLQAMTSK